MKILLTSIFVNDQEKALRFYTEVLGFLKKADVPAGGFRWLTVTSPDPVNNVDLLLEPNVNPIAETYQKGIYESGIPATAFFVDDIEQEYRRLTASGVEFHSKPEASEGTISAMFDDTSGNLIQLIQL